MNYISDVFSLRMLFPLSAVSFKTEEISAKDIPQDVMSFVRHHETAGVLSRTLNKNIPVRRGFLTLKPEDKLYVLQLNGDRFQEQNTLRLTADDFTFYKTSIISYHDELTKQ